MLRKRPKLCHPVTTKVKLQQFNLTCKSLLTLNQKLLYLGVKLSPNSWTLHGIVPVSAILNLNIILLTVLGKACHLKSVFECQLNYAPLDNNDPYTLVASSRVCRQSAFKGLVLVVVIFQYVSTGGCKKTSCQTKNAKCMYCTILS